MEGKPRRNSARDQREREKKGGGGTQTGVFGWWDVVCDG